ncbi:MAG: YceI family protein [Bacteroidia bacterium]
MNSKIKSQEVRCLRLLVSCFLILASCFCAAQNQQWEIVSSTISFKIKNAGFNVNGTFSGLAGIIEFNLTKTIGNKIDVSVDAKSVNTEGSGRDAHIKRDDFFAVEKFPKITMSATTFTKEANGKFIGIFALTIKGTTNKVPVEFTFTEQDSKATFMGSFKINRLDYKVGSSSFILNDDATISIEVTCRKK